MGSPVKISGLPAASALSGSEILPMVQGVVTSRDTLQNAANWALRTNTSGFSHAASNAAGSVGASLAAVFRPKDAPYLAVGDGTTDDSTAVQAALTAAAGGVFDGAGLTYFITATLNFPSNTVIQNTIWKAKVASAAFATTTSKTNITLRNCKVLGEGTYSSVTTFALCDQILIERCTFDVALTGSVLSSVALRSQGTTNMTVRDCQLFNADSMLYLDKSGATNSDLIKVLNCYFEHTFLGGSDTPTSIYQFNCNHLLVDGCTFRNVYGTVGGTKIGYSVYEGDGSSQSLTVVNCITHNDSAKAHVMVQSAKCPAVLVENNKYFGAAMGVSASSYLCQVGTALGNVIVRGNYSTQGAIFIIGGATAATALRSAIVDNNVINKLEQNTPPIRLGVQDSYFISYAEIRGNTAYCSYAGSVNVSECAFALVSGNRLLNWNTQDKAPHTTYAYTAGIYWQQNTVVSSGVIRDNILENNTLVGGETGFCDYAISAESATAYLRIRLIDNSVGTMVDSNYVNVFPDSGVYTPTLFNTTNLDASTADECVYYRNGTVCMVTGSAAIDPTNAAPTATILGISLPIPSDLASSVQAGGTGASAAGQTETFVIYGDATNNRVTLDGLARSNANHGIWFQFGYKII